MLIIALDKTGERFYHTVLPWWGVILGFIISLCTKSVGGRYLSMFLMASGYAGRWHTPLLLFWTLSICVGVPLTAVWMANVITRPPSYVPRILNT